MSRPPLASTALDASRRESDLAALAADDSRVDLVVVGGGITGVGIALDAASRGLTTVLLEAHDLAFGTSRWSSKLAHGGLRYLATGNVGIARRSAAERRILLERTAPHLVHPLTQVVPVFEDTPIKDRLLPRLGFLAGDLLSALTGTGADLLPRSGSTDAEGTTALVPGVRRAGLRSSLLNRDGQLVDDARLVTAVARTAAGHGARILTRARVEEARGTHVRFVDTLTGAGYGLRARAVVNATGVWVGELESDIRVRPSRGTHLVLDAAALGHPTGALTVAVPGGINRFCFLLPVENGRVLLGLTDVDAPGPVPDVPVPTASEIAFLLSVVNPALERPLEREDVLGAFAGLRPLVDSGDGDTADLSREHVIRTGGDGLVTITGGKLTEYRLMAEQVVDHVVGATGLDARPCRTRNLPLVGATGAPAADGLPPSLIRRFGGEASDVVTASLLDRPLEPVAPGLDATRAEFSFHVTHEGAFSVDDVLDRRSRLGLVPSDRAAAEPCAHEALAAAGL